MSYIMIAMAAAPIRKFVATTKLDAIQEAQDLQKQGHNVTICSLGDADFRVACASLASGQGNSMMIAPRKTSKDQRQWYLELAAEVDASAKRAHNPWAKNALFYLASAWQALAKEIDEPSMAVE